MMLTIQGRYDFENVFKVPFFYLFLTDATNTLQMEHMAIIGIARGDEKPEKSMTP